MVTLALVVDDGLLSERMQSVLDRHPAVAALFSGTNSQDISQLVASHAIDAVCFVPMSPAELLRIRRVIVGSLPHGSIVRTALLADRCDATLVYHALGYGIDDVVDLSTDEDRLRAQLTTFATGDSRACESFIVAPVPVPHSVIHGLINYADQVDRQIVSLISVGYTDREISEILHYSHQLIRNRVSAVMLRSGIRNRTQLSARHTFESIEGGALGQPYFNASTQ